MKKFQFYQFDELCGNILTNIINHVSNDPLPRLKRLIRQFIYDDHNTAKGSGIVCPEWNEETQKRILGASYDTVVKLIRHPWKQTISDCLFNGIIESFEIDHIMPKNGIFRRFTRSKNYWEIMRIHHMSNLQLLPQAVNREKSSSVMNVMTQSFDKRGIFVKWTAIPHNIKRIGEDANECKKYIHSIVMSWINMGPENLLIEMANKRMGIIVQSVNMRISLDLKHSTSDVSSEKDLDQLFNNNDTDSSCNESETIEKESDQMFDCNEYDSSSNDKSVDGDDGDDGDNGDNGDSGDNGDDGDDGDDGEDDDNGEENQEDCSSNDTSVDNDDDYDHEDGDDGEDNDNGEEKEEDSVSESSERGHDDESSSNDYVDDEEASMAEEDDCINGSMVSVVNPYRNPTIEGHHWQVSRDRKMGWFKKYIPIETDSPYFRSKPPWSTEILPSINEHDVVLSGLNMKKKENCRSPGMRRFINVLKMAQEAYGYFTERGDNLMRWRIVVKVVDELRHGQMHPGNQNHVRFVRVVNESQYENGKISARPTVREMDFLSAATSIQYRLRTR